MGQFRIEVVAVGGHGCQREKKDGERVGVCGNLNCPDCKVRKLVEDIGSSGIVESATLTHWPGTEWEVRDDLKTGVRSGSFRA